MRHDHEVVLTRKDGSARNFHIYGQPTPHVGDVISLPIDGQLITEMVQSVNHTDAVEI
jgi:hypothetical protein